MGYAASPVTVKKSVQAPATPLEAQVRRLYTNRRNMREIVTLKNTMWGLSEKTRAAWLEFKNGFWEDMKFMESQKLLYQAEYLEENKELTAQRQRDSFKRMEVRKVERQQALKINCSRCDDSGTSNSKTHATCKCPAGYELARSRAVETILTKNPDWIWSDDNKVAFCQKCKRGFGRVQAHDC